LLVKNAAACHVTTSSAIQRVSRKVNSLRQSHFVAAAVADKIQINFLLLLNPPGAAAILCLFCFLILDDSFPASRLWSAVR
jgi:hypothetical protein